MQKLVQMLVSQQRGRETRGFCLSHRQPSWLTASLMECELSTQLQLSDQLTGRLALAGGDAPPSGTAGDGTAHSQPVHALLALTVGCAVLRQGTEQPAAHLQISDLGLLVPSMAQWFPKWTSLKMPGKCRSIQRKVLSRMTCWREVTTTKSNMLPRRFRLCMAPAAHSRYPIETYCSDTSGSAPAEALPAGGLKEEKQPGSWLLLQAQEQARSERPCCQPAVQRRSQALPVRNRVTMELTALCPMLAVFRLQGQDREGVSTVV